MWVRKRFDIGWGNLTTGLCQCLLRPDRPRVMARLHDLWAGEERTLVAFSIRSAFDALLEALNLPEGSEVVMSAITIHDMPRIIRAHGLVPVPVDINPDTLAPEPEALRKAITPKTKIALLTHLFGSRMDVAPLAELLREQDILIIEDLAQGYKGPDYHGDDAADVSLFSFGTIKTTTAMGAALFTVRKPELLAQLRDKQAEWPMHTHATYFRRLFKYSMLKAVSGRIGVSTIVALSRLFGVDYGHLMNASTRGFPGPDFFERIRRQPCAALLAMLARRLQCGSMITLDRRTANGRLMTELLRGKVETPGADVAEHSYWLYVINVADPNATMAKLRAAGFDSTQGDSLIAVPPPEDRADQFPHQAKRILDHGILLPIYRAMTKSGVRKMAKVLTSD
jgi:perosamine synthetase